MIDFLLNFRVKGSETVAKCKFDPTFRDGKEGMNCLQFLVHMQNMPLVQMVLDKAKENGMQFWNPKYSVLEPLVTRDFINRTK